MERIVVVHLQNITSDTDVVVREGAANFLANLSKDCESKRCLELLDILDKVRKCSCFYFCHEILNKFMGVLLPT